MYKQGSVTTGLKKSFKKPPKTKTMIFISLFSAKFWKFALKILDYRLLKNYSVIELVHVFYWFNNNVSWTQED